jgi:D-alanyl-D-alanine carboxypeptidase (penicillin-binding protein 5/6)
MQNGKVRLTVCAVLTALAAGFSAPAFAQSTTVSHASHKPLFTAFDAPVTTTAPEVFGRAAFLLDARTGEARLSKQADRRMPIASLTKVMTAYLVLREADLTDSVEVTSADVEYAESGGGTTADLRVGDRLTVENLLYGLMLPSGADAAHALARAYGPGVPAFVDKMNATARELGLRDTLYVNADGLPTPRGDGYSTARDQARLAELALRDPRFVEITSTARHSVTGTADHRSYTWTNTNKLLGEPGALGVKTGFTQAAGYCLSFAAERDGNRYVGVILGESASARRFETAGALLDWAAGRSAA